MATFRRAVCVGSAVLLLAGFVTVDAASASPATWHTVATPALPTNFEGELAGVSCPAAKSCFAVGEVDNPDDGTQGGHYLLHWNGTAWSLVATPQPAGSSGEFHAVACSATNACTAVGEYINSSGRSRALIERWNGHTWALQSSPVPPTGDALLYTVACPSATSCFAAGRQLHLNTALIEHWNGHTWALQSVPHPNTSRDNQYFGLSCTAITACVAAGGTFPASGTAGGAPLIDRWNGSNWTPQPTAALPAGRVGYFEAVSCASSSMCLAVGSTIDPHTQFSDRRLVQQWNGHNWAIVVTPAPATAGPNFFTGVSCPTTSACVVVGAAGFPNGPPLAERRTGSAWSVDTTVTVGSGSLFRAVTCTTTLACTAVGNGYQGGGTTPIVERSP